jgi:hypothetical protein
MKNSDLDNHISELLSYINILDTGLFQGKELNKVNNLKKYLGDILIQVMDIKSRSSTLEVEQKVDNET